ncbi:hypothetical protein HRbin33_01612 [bacterium HR33]|nr:hypothetical protein HRbin33_01612 [bacterium HR33]
MTLGLQRAPYAMLRAPVALPCLSILALVLNGCASAPARTEGAAPRPEPAAAARSDAELEALYRARIDSATAVFTEADVRFMTGMIGHHAQAILMSEMAPDRAAEPAIRTLAARIINAQKDEIATMEQWLRDRGQPVPEIHFSGINMMVHGPQYAAHMPGMLTEEQLRQLEAARGSEFDILFLQFMIQHHRGAVTMVRELFETDGAAQDEVVFRLASDIQVDQLTEIARMESMLAALSARRQR